MLLKTNFVVFEISFHNLYFFKDISRWVYCSWYEHFVKMPNTSTKPAKFSNRVQKYRKDSKLNVKAHIDTCSCCEKYEAKI